MLGEGHGVAALVIGNVFEANDMVLGVFINADMALLNAVVLGLDQIAAGVDEELSAAATEIPGIYRFK